MWPERSWEESVLHLYTFFFHNFNENAVELRINVHGMFFFLLNAIDDVDMLMKYKYLGYVQSFYLAEHVAGIVF